MTGFSRRGLLSTGGALGVGGALALGSPTWTWAATGSIVGTGTGADPRWVWDDLADPVIAMALDRGDVPLINDLLKDWTTNGQALPTGLPGYVRDFIETARRLPAWTNLASLDNAYPFTEKRGTYLGALYGLNSGMMSTVIPHEAKAVYYSKGGADMRDRIAKTAKLGYDIGVQGAFRPEGQMIVTCVKTRMVHAAVRHLLPQSPFWKGTADQEIPISQRDLMVTWHSLASSVWDKLMQWRIQVPAKENAGYLHLWQVTAAMLGIRDEYIPASWADALSQRDQVLTPILAPTQEGISLANTLLDLGENIDGTIISRPVLESMTRFMLGDEIAGWLHIPRHPGLDESIRLAWPGFIAFREAGLAFPLSRPLYWSFDEFLRQMVLLYLNDGKRINIDIPTGNNPNLSN